MAMNFAKERGATTIALTRFVASPVSEQADIRLFAKSEMGPPSSIRSSLRCR